VAAGQMMMSGSGDVAVDSGAVSHSHNHGLMVTAAAAAAAVATAALLERPPLPMARGSGPAYMLDQQQQAQPVAERDFSVPPPPPAAPDDEDDLA
jgi:hypothetical protein